MECSTNNPTELNFIDRLMYGLWGPGQLVCPPAAVEVVKSSQIAPGVTSLDII
jgi:hypothetical protein